MKFLLILDKKVDAKYTVSSPLEHSSQNLSVIFNQIATGKKNYDSHEVYIEGECQTTLAFVKTDVVITYYDANGKVTRITTKEIKVKVRDNKFERTPVIIEGFVLNDGYVEVTAIINKKSPSRKSQCNVITYK